MLKIRDTVKVKDKTLCGGIEKECIPIGTICRVVGTNYDDREGFTVGIIPETRLPYSGYGEYWYLACGVEKGHINRKGVNVLGGKQSEAYRDASIRGSLYSDMYRQMKREYGAVSSYKSIKRKYIPDLHDFIDCYAPPTALAEQIDAANALMSIRS